MRLSASEIRGILPHRFPIALVDRVLELVAGASLRAIKCVTANEPCFAALDDDVPDVAWAYPQTLMIESFLQAAGILLTCSLQQQAPGEPAVLLFGGLSDCVFHDSAQPGDTLEHIVRLERMFAGSAVVSGQTSIGGRVVMTLGQAVVVLRPARALEQA
jgi:3-hydroxyacyl-[acyl-carrier-protein] dehydratase